MGFFRQIWVNRLIGVILVLVVGSTTVYLIGTWHNLPNAYSQPTPSSQAPAIVQSSPTSLPTSIDQTTVTGWKTHTNSKYRLSFDYPTNYTIGFDNDYGVSLIGEDKTHVIEINFQTPQTPQANGKENQAFSDFAIQAAISDSQANGPGGYTAYFDKIVQQMPLQNPYGLNGYKLYFHWVNKKFNEQGNLVTVQEAIVDRPILSYDVSKRTNNVLRAVEVLIGPPDNSASSIDPSILDRIGNSIRFF